MSKSIRELFECDLQYEEYEDYCAKQARMAAHRAFDLLWKFDHMTRSEAYAWLAQVMGKTKAQAHILYFNEDECNKVVKEVDNYWSQSYEKTCKSRVPK